MSTPTPDQSNCEVGQHQACGGYTEDESDPESCMCDCHTADLDAEREAATPQATGPAVATLSHPEADTAWAHA